MSPRRDHVAALFSAPRRHIFARDMEVRIGLDRASMGTNVLINNRADVGRARESMIFAPARAREGRARRARPEAGLAARNVLRWIDDDDAKEAPNPYRGGIDLMAMNKRATIEGRCVTAKDVRRFRRDAAAPTLLRSGERLSSPPEMDASKTYGRPSSRRSADENRRTDGFGASTTIASLIRQDFAGEWIAARLAARASRRVADAPSYVIENARSVSNAHIDACASIKTTPPPFKMKRFARIRSKVAAMGYF